MTMFEAWQRAVDALEARVRAARDFVEGRGPAPTGEWGHPPGPVPPALLPRLRLLHAQNDELVHRLQRHLADAPPSASPYR